jgi:hypothetical protein
VNVRGGGRGDVRYGKVPTDGSLPHVEGDGGKSGAIWIGGRYFFGAAETLREALRRWPASATAQRTQRRRSVSFRYLLRRNQPDACDGYPRKRCVSGSGAALLAAT